MTRVARSLAPAAASGPRWPGGWCRTAGRCRWGCGSRCGPTGRPTRCRCMTMTPPIRLRTRPGSRRRRIALAASTRWWRCRRDDPENGDRGQRRRHPRDDGPACDVAAAAGADGLADAQGQRAGAGGDPGLASGKRVKSARAGSYSLSKYAAVALAHGLRHEGFADGIRATAICPGFVATDMARAVSDFPAERMTDPADLARIIALILDLPNEASVAEFTVNCQLEESF
jgi:hypothetical protein